MADSNTTEYEHMIALPNLDMQLHYQIWIFGYTTKYGNITAVPNMG